MRRVVCALGILIAVACGSAGTAGAEEAAAIAGVGWWSDNPTSSAPEGGVAVGARPGGSSSSVAAVRVAVLSRSITSATLILQESGGVNQSNGQLKVCTTPNQWKTGKGPMAEAPKPECGGGEAKLERNATTGSWAADVRSLLTASSQQSSVSLMIVPASAGAVPVGFDIQFRPPQLQAEGEPASSDFDTGPGFSSDEFSGTDQSSGSSGPSSTFSSSGFAFDAATASQFATPMSGAEQATAEAPVESTLAPVAGQGDDQVAVGLPARSAGVSEATGRPVVQALFFVAVAAAIGIVAGVGRNRLRQLQPG